MNPTFSQLKEGRVILFIMLTLISLVMLYALRPKQGLLSYSKHTFLRSLLFFLAVGLPVGLGISSLIGFHHSALILTEQLIFSIRAVFLILFIAFVCKRLLLISRRRMARQSMRNEPEQDEENAENTLSKQERIKLQLENISEINTQTSKLINIGAFIALLFSFWAIWSDSLPALKVLDDIPIWSSDHATRITTFSSDTTDLLATTTTENSESPSGAKGFISLQDILISITVAISTYLFAINLPGLLEIVILNRLQLKEGTGFAIKTALRYLIVIIGVVWSFNAIGISWGKVQWLAAAVSLGIGFGLQEIIANFVAGIILLFEKPMRIGDLVTVGGISGKVTKIEIRATTILQFNNRELIVPNKEFITGQLQNWTLSNDIMRAEITLGIAYGSDTKLAQKLLYEEVEKHPLTMDTPSPSVIYSSFGASSLDFIIRFHVESAGDLVPAQSELHFAIDEAFREAKIEMAFPQQDIHIRSIEAPLNVLTPSIQEV